MTTLDLVKQIYADYARGDLAAVLTACDEDFAFVWPADPVIGRFAGTVRGKNGFLERIAFLQSEFDYLAFTPLDFIADGDRVAVRIEMRLKRRVTGRELVMHAAHFLTFHNGKLVELVEYYDTALAAQVL